MLNALQIADPGVDMNESSQRWLLMVAAAWNILGGVSALLDPAQHFAQLYSATLTLTDPVQLFFYRCTWINVIAWGIGYLIAARLPGSRTAILSAGAIGKSVYFAACVDLYLSGAGKPLMLLTGVADLFFAALFVLVLVRRRP
jgi:hypothetical protein